MDFLVLGVDLLVFDVVIGSGESVTLSVGRIVTPWAEKDSGEDASLVSTILEEFEAGRRDAVKVYSLLILDSI